MKDLDRFLNKVEKIPFTDCWIWAGALKPNGYGDFYLNGKVQTAHRASYQLFIGSIDKSVDICHKCDLRHCVNPNHLFAGSRSENMKDASNKGRLGHRVAKLSYEQSQIIKESSEKNYLLAQKYNVSQNIISRIKKGIHYKKEFALAR